MVQKKKTGFKHYYEDAFMPMLEQAKQFMSECKLETFTREKVLNIMTAFALERDKGQS
jgi:hypothetical protein